MKFNSILLVISGIQQISGLFAPVPNPAKPSRYIRIKATSKNSGSIQNVNEADGSQSGVVSSASESDLTAPETTSTILAPQQQKSSSESTSFPYQTMDPTYYTNTSHSSISSYEVAGIILVILFLVLLSLTFCKCFWCCFGFYPRP